MREIAKTIGIVLLAVIVWGIAWNGVNMAAVAIWPQELADATYIDAPAPLLTLLVLSMALSVAVGALAAKLSEARARTTVQVLAGVQLLIGIAVQASYWETMPPWFNLSFLFGIVPATLVGGYLVYGRKVAR